MPIKIPNELPAVRVLNEENIFVMTDTRAITQDIRPLKILVLNLMPKKTETETQLSRLLGNSPLQVEFELIHTKSHVPKHTPKEYLLAFYKTFDDVKHRKFDGLIITGAPVEKMPFEDVTYWQELCEIMEWSKTHVTSTFHICWGAQAGLYYHYGIPKYPLSEKCSGVFRHNVRRTTAKLVRGFDSTFFAPHSRHTEVRAEDIHKVSDREILADSDDAGVYIVTTKKGRQIFVMGHSEYDADTLKNEYFRDLDKGMNPNIPANYFTNDDPKKKPLVRWRSHAHLLFSNWLNYFVYQNTQYDLEKL